MTERPQASVEDLVADYVRASMRVAMPDGMIPEVMRTVAEMPQARRSWFASFSPLLTAGAAAGVTAVVIALGLFITSARNVAAPDPTTTPEPTATPAPTLTPEVGWILTDPGDEIRIPAVDAEGQFGTIVLRRGDEVAGYDGYLPLEGLQFGDIFFIEVEATYEVARPASESYGNIDFGWAVDADGDGFDADDAITQHLGYSIDGLEPDIGRPLLPFTSQTGEPMTGWLPLALPANGAEFDIYLVQLAGEPAGGQLQAANAVLVRTPGEPVGFTTVDLDNLPEPSAPQPMPSLQQLPTPMPSPAPTFEATANADADALFAETQTCDNVSVGVTITFPAAWHSNAAYEDLPACTLFGPDPIDAELVYNGFVSELPPIHLFEAPGWIGGADQPGIPVASLARAPLGDRIAWLITYPDSDVETYGYLVPLTDDAYGPFLRGATGAEHRAVLERMLLLLEFDQ